MLIVTEIHLYVPLAFDMGLPGPRRCGRSLSRNMSL
jgi:hypothetical protein